MLLPNLFVSFGYFVVFIWARHIINSIVFFDVSSSITCPRSQFVVYHFAFSGSSLFSTAHFTVNTFEVLLCCFTHSFCASSLQPDKSWCTDSPCSPHNLHLSSSNNPLIYPLLLLCKY